MGDGAKNFLGGIAEKTDGSAFGDINRLFILFILFILTDYLIPLDYLFLQWFILREVFLTIYFNFDYIFLYT